MNLHKKKGLFLLAWLLLGLIVACGSFASGYVEQNKAEPYKVPAYHPEQKVTIEFGHPWEFARDSFDKLFAEFERRYPNIEVQVTFIPPAAYISTLRTQYAGGTGPDVIFLWRDNVYDWYSHGLVLDVTDSMNSEGWGEWITEAIRKDNQVDGRDIMIPLRGTTHAVYYNKNVFNELGLSVPSTWDELLDILEIVKQDGRWIPLTPHGGNWPVHLNVPVYGLMGQTAYHEENDLFEGNVKFVESEGIREAYRKFKHMFDQGYFSEGWLGISADVALSMFYSQQSAMALSGSWQYYKFEEIEDFEWDIFEPFPQIYPEIPSRARMNFDTVMAFSGTKHPEASIELMKFLTNPEIQQWITQELPGLEGVSSSKGVVTANPVLEQFAEFIAVEPLTFDYPGLIGEEAREELDALTAPYLLGDITLEELMESVQKAIDRSAPVQYRR